MSHVCRLLFLFFTDTSIYLIDQLVGLAELSHLLLFIYRKSKSKFMTKDLYSDLQSTIQDAFICTSFFKTYNPNQKLHLMLLGTDQLENLFSSVLCMTHARNCDYLEEIDRLNMAIN